MHPILEERRYLIPFRTALLPQLGIAVKIIGSGVAGLRAALAAAAESAIMVRAKGELHDSNTAWAQGGIAAAMGRLPDDVETHVQDTLIAGCGLCDEAVVRRIGAASAEHMGELVAMGMPFDRDAEGRLQTGREGGHRSSRVLHAHGDATGQALADTLINQVRSHDSIRIFENCFALDLLTEGADADRCRGAITHNLKHGLQVIWASATILASGGTGSR